ncbi:RHS repeat-associated core domain-containing protein [Desulfonema magnum]|uniref:RHS repeat-containing protein n=1 Tax=Desulfonema magnum TaxID=45655 RepID=A0A975GPH4_9BACT|nr:RHS repeat-associated core domain-containing protein [Desulfonema magnum]QTA89006.1 RHS repeat-containing protein [Desulfonema magnum]
MIRKIAILIFAAMMLLSYFHTGFAATSVKYEYDANGNLIRGEGKFYEYNDANKLVRVRHGDENGSVIAEYVYDSAGQRVKKMENGATTYYIGKHFEKQTEGTHPGESSYYFANGQRVARKDPAGKMFWFHANHLGGTDTITDSAGKLAERTRYFPFGEIREGGNERYTFTGKEKDKVTDFYYFEARHYYAGYRHFTQADIIAPDIYDPQSLNRYAYVRNNPIKYNDPSGNEEDRFQDLFQSDSPYYDIDENGRFVSRNSEPLNRCTENSSPPKNSLTTRNCSCIMDDNLDKFPEGLGVTKAGDHTWGKPGKYPQYNGSESLKWCTTYITGRYNITWDSDTSVDGKKLRAHARNWLIHAKNQGYSTGDRPANLSIVITNESSYGHVLIVEYINHDTQSIHVSESNYPRGGRYNERDIPINDSRIQGYIYTEESYW